VEQLPPLVQPGWRFRIATAGGQAAPPELLAAFAAASA